MAVIRLGTNDVVGLGFGFNTFLSSLRGPAVKCDAFPKIPDVAGKSVHYELSVVENRESLKTQMNVSVAASFKAFKGAGQASAEIFRFTEIHSYSVFVVVHVSVTIPPYSIGNDYIPYQLNAAALKATKNKKEFLTSYGNSFVEGISSGGQMYAICELLTDSAEERQRLSVEVSGSVGTYSGSTSFSSSMEKLLENRRVKAVLDVIGAPVRPLPTTWKEVIEYAKDFSMQVQPVPTSVTVKDFSTVWVEADLGLNIEYELALAASSLDAVRGILQDIIEVENSSERFLPSDPAKVAAFKVKVLDAAEKLEEYGRNILGGNFNVSRPKFDTLTAEAAVTLPRPEVDLRLQVYFTDGSEAIGGTGQWVGSRNDGDGKVISAYSLKVINPLPGSRLYYAGWSAPSSSGDYVHESQRTPFSGSFVGLAVQWGGPAAYQYRVCYQVYSAQYHESKPAYNGSSIGASPQASPPIKAIKVWFERDPLPE